MSYFTPLSCELHHGPVNMQTCYVYYSVYKVSPHIELYIGYHTKHERNNSIWRIIPLNICYVKIIIAFNTVSGFIMRHSLLSCTQYYR